MVQQLTREERVLRAARAVSYTYAGGRKAIECKLCGNLVYTSKKGASAEYEELAEHLVSRHPEIHSTLEKTFYHQHLG